MIIFIYHLMKYIIKGCEYLKILFPVLTASYVVQPGDILWCLAKKFNTTVDDIVELNDIENLDLIYPGQKLLILKKVW